MVPTPCNNEDREDDVHDEEDLVALSTEPQAGHGHHDDACDGGYNAPDPVRFLLFRVHCTLSFV